MRSLSMLFLMVLQSLFFEGSAQTDLLEKSLLKITGVEPTVLFKRNQNHLEQAVDIFIDNGGQSVKGVLTIRLSSGKEQQVKLGTIGAGSGKYRIFIPENREVIPVEFILETESQEKTSFIADWTPRKHWEVCLIPISHHDLGYTHSIEHVMEKYVGIYEDVLRFCEQTDDYPEEAKFRYSAEGAWSMQYFIEHSNRETLEKLSKYMSEGRIEVHALIGNEITDILGHEEMIRLMYPSFRIANKFGGEINTGSITDVTGLSWGLPTALSNAGVDYFFAGLPDYFEWWSEKFSYMRPFWDEENILRSHGRPDAFYWGGPDGSKILVYYQGTYGCWSPKSYQQVMEELPGMLDAMDERGNPFSVMRYAGYGCGDNTETDIVVSNLAREWNSKWAYPRLIVSTSSMFFEKLEKQCADVRTFSGDLPQTDYSAGAISTAEVTALNRVAHDRLNAAEKLATMSNLLINSAYPAEVIRDAYYNMLLYDEHTWGMWDPVGKVQDWAWSVKSSFAYKAAGLSEMILSGRRGYTDGGPGAIANAIAFQDTVQHIVVFNPLSKERNDLVNLIKLVPEVPFDLIDTRTGEKVIYQVSELNDPLAPVPYAAGRYAREHFTTTPWFLDQIRGLTLSFMAEDVPSMGYKTYKIVPAADSPSVAASLALTDNSLENRFYKIELNPQTGTIKSIYDKELDIELVDRNAPHQVNQVITRWVGTGEEESPASATIRKGENGPVYASLVISTSVAGCPQVNQEIRLYENMKRIDIANRLLKDMTPAMEVFFAFPFLMEDPDFRFEGPLSVIEPLKDQFPGSNTHYYAVQHWANVSDGHHGITLVPVDAHLLMFGGLHPSEVSQAHHGVTPPGFGEPFVKEFNKGHMYSYAINSNFCTNFSTTQAGDILFRYSITSHRGNWVEGNPGNLGWAAGNPLIPFTLDGKREGTLHESLSFCRVDKPNVMLLTMKRAENNEGIIIRLNETEGKDTEVSVTFPFLDINKVYETNLVELNEKLHDFQKQTIRVRMKPFGIKTFRILSTTHLSDRNPEL